MCLFWFGFSSDKENQNKSQAQNGCDNYYVYILHGGIVCVLKDGFERISDLNDTM